MRNQPAAYIICTSPRSGSTMLCKLLAATGVAGAPASYFHRPMVADWRNGLGLPPVAAATEAGVLRETFAVAIEAGRGGTGLFGLRLHRHSFAFFMGRVRALYPAGSDRVRLEAAFGPTRLIHLTREDEAAQAISYIRAQQSGLWHRNADGSELERLSPPQPLRYDAAAIAAEAAKMGAMDAAWADWFRAEGLTPLRLTYDALSAAPEAALRRVLAHLGLDPEAAAGAAAPTAKLADGVNAEWLARFRAEGVS